MTRDHGQHVEWAVDKGGCIIKTLTFLGYVVIDDCHAAAALGSGARAAAGIQLCHEAAEALAEAQLGRSVRQQATEEHPAELPEAEAVGDPAAQRGLSGAG